MTKDKHTNQVEAPTPSFVDCGWCKDGHKSEIEAALCEALNEWDYASKYKGEYLREKHGDLIRINKIRKKLLDK